MIWIRKLLRKACIRKVLTWHLLFGLMHQSMAPTAVPLFLAIVEVLQYAAYAGPAILKLIGVKSSPIPLEVPSRDPVGNMISDHLKQGQKLAEKSISITGQTIPAAPPTIQTAQTVSRAWSVLINKAPETFSYRPSIDETKGSFLEVVTSNETITIPLQALNIGVNVITVAHTANQIIKYYQNSDVLNQSDIHRINQEEAIHQHQLATNTKYAQKYLQHKLKTVSLISQAPGHYSEAQRFIACGELFYGRANQLQGWDRIAATQALNALRKINIDSNGIIKAHLTAEEQGDALFVYNTFQSQIDRRASYESYRKAEERFNIANYDAAPSINEYIFDWHKKGEKGACGWLQTLKGEMPYNQDRRELYTAHKQLFKAIDTAFKDHYRGQKSLYTAQGLLKVAHGDPLYKNLSAPSKKELLADAKKIRQFNTIIAIRNEYKVAIEKTLKLTQKQAASFAADTYLIIDLLMAETPPEHIIEYLVASCATNEKYNLFFDGNGILKFRTDNQKNIVVGHPKFARYQQADHKALLVRLNKLAFLHPTEENAPYITRAYDFLHHAAQASDVQLVETYLKAVDDIFPLLANDKITQERLAIRFRTWEREINQTKKCDSILKPEQKVTAQEPTIVPATALSTSTVSVPQPSVPVKNSISDLAKKTPIHQNPYAHITFAPSLSALGVAIEDALAIMQQQHVEDPPQSPNTQKSEPEPLVDTGNCAPQPPENEPEDEKEKNEETIKPLGRGSTGRTEPKNLYEQLAMKEVMSDPLNGARNLEEEGLIMTDLRWLAEEGWVKMARNIECPDGTHIDIHYVYNKLLNLFDDFKFIDKAKG